MGVVGGGGGAGGGVGVFFFFQAEDGIRDYDVTGVQTCALPISNTSRCESRKGAFFIPSLLPLKSVRFTKRLMRMVGALP